MNNQPINAHAGQARKIDRKVTVGRPDDSEDMIRTVLFFRIEKISKLPVWLCVRVAPILADNALRAVAIIAHLCSNQ